MSAVSGEATEEEQEEEGKAWRHRLFDAHCHLQDERVYAKAGEIISESIRSGVDKISVNGCSAGEDWRRVEKLYRDFPDTVVPNFGLHPWFLPPTGADWQSELRSLLLRHPGAGLGEVGLDKCKKVLDRTPLDVQTDLFLRQLRIAKDLGRPVSVHCVKAWGRMQECLQAEGPFPAGVLLHSFMGPVEVIKGLSKLNAYFSLSLSVLKLKEQRARDVIKAIPLDRLVLETDSPDSLCRPTWDGTRHIQSCIGSVQQVETNCSIDSIRREEEQEEEVKSVKLFNVPSNVNAVMKLVAAVTGHSEETIALRTYANASKLFLPIETA